MSWYLLKSKLRRQSRYTSQTNFQRKGDMRGLYLLQISGKFNSDYDHVSVVAASIFSVTNTSHVELCIQV